MIKAIDAVTSSTAPNVSVTAAPKGILLLRRSINGRSAEAKRIPVKSSINAESDPATTTKRT